MLPGTVRPLVFLFLFKIFISKIQLDVFGGGLRKTQNSCHFVSLWMFLWQNCPVLWIHGSKRCPWVLTDPNMRPSGFNWFLVIIRAKVTTSHWDTGNRNCVWPCVWCQTWLFGWDSTSSLCSNGAGCQIKRALTDEVYLVWGLHLGLDKNLLERTLQMWNCMSKCFYFFLSQGVSPSNF